MFLHKSIHEHGIQIYFFSCPKVLMNDWICPSQCGIGGVTWYFLIEMTAWITIYCRKITGTLSRARMLGFDSWVNKWLTCFVSFLLLAMCSCVYKLGFSTNTSSVTVFGCHKGTRFAHQRGLENIWVVRIWRCNMMTFYLENSGQVSSKTGGWIFFLTNCFIH